MIGNAVINKWVLDDSGVFWAMEFSDAVESNLYVVTITGGVKVGLSDYVLPNYFCNDTVRPYNKMNTLTAPFTVDNGGYAITIQDNQVVAIYGSKVTDDKKVLVEKDMAEIRLSSKLFNS